MCDHLAGITWWEMAWVLRQVRSGASPEPGAAGPEQLCVPQGRAVGEPFTASRECLHGYSPRGPGDISFERILRP